MFEPVHHPLLPRPQFLLRLLRGLIFASCIIAFSLGIGVMGYHGLNGLGWIDSLLEASMILGGMGPVATMQNDAAKLFASFYALYSGLVLIGVMGILLSPVVHRIMHSLHVSDR